MPVPDPFAPVRALIRSRLAETGVASLALAVAKDGEVIWEEACGWASREGRVPTTPHTLYSLASISKPITATGLMILQERGLLDLDRPANDSLGCAGLTARIGNAEDATLRRIANHTSGLPLHYHFFYEDEPYDRPPMHETLRRYGNLVTPPGEKYQYANLGYGILDHIISRLSGKPYADFIHEEIFIPLNMPRASVSIAPGLEPYAAVRYTPAGQPLPFYDFDHPGASAVFCSAHDLVRFGMFHLKARLPDQKRILSDDTIDAMQIPTAAENADSGYGVGWRIVDDTCGYRTVGHDGSMGGVRTRLLLLPSETLAIAVLTNGQTDLPAQIADEVLAALLPNFAENRARREAERKSQPRPAPSPFRPTPDLLGPWEGRVHTCNGTLPLTLEFRADGHIHARLGDQLKTLVNDPRFENGVLTGKLAGNIGTQDANKRPYHLHLNLNLRGEILNGVLTALSLPGNRSGNALSHWTELAKYAN